MEKLDPRLEQKVSRLMQEGAGSSERLKHKPPVKIIPVIEYKQEGSLEVRFSPNQPVSATQEVITTPGIQAVIDQLDNFGANYMPFIKTSEGPYVIARLNATQIVCLQGKPYVARLIDDSPKPI